MQKAATKSIFACAIILSIALAATMVAAPTQAYASKAGNAIANCAASVSYTRAVYKAQGTGTTAYMRACKKLRKNGYYAKNQKQMQCNVPIAVAVRYSGVDPDFPTTNKDIYKFMKKSKKWKCMGNYNGKVSMLKPGDILIRISGVTTYKSKKHPGKTLKAETNHACIYVGKTIANNAYKYNKKTDANVGAPGKNRVFVSAHTSKRKPSKRSAACLETAKEAYADYRMIVFRYVG